MPVHMWLFLQVYGSHKEWAPILRWAVKFCSESPNIFSGPHATQLELVSCVYSIAIEPVQGHDWTAVWNGLESPTCVRFIGSH